MGELQGYLRQWGNVSRMATIRRVPQGYRPGWISSGANGRMSSNRPRRLPDKLFLDVETMGGECGGAQLPSAPYQSGPCAPPPPPQVSINTAPCAPPKQWM